MAVYSISDLEKITGVKAHTLRAWEHRYGIVEPKRTKTNVRYYVDEDLRDLLNVALLRKNGMRISAIADLPAPERARKVADLNKVPVSSETQLDALTLAAVEMDEVVLTHLLDTNIEQRGLEETMIEVVYPFLNKLGLLYLTGSFRHVQEAFVENIIRRKLLAATDALPTSREDRERRPTLALYLPRGEEQELSLHFAHYLLRVRRFPVLYLGADKSVSDLRDLSRLRAFDYLFTFLSDTLVNTPGQDYLTRVLEACPRATLLFSAQRPVGPLPDSPRVKNLPGLQDLLDFLAQLN